jgi:hypothetical protein
VLAAETAAAEPTARIEYTDAFTTQQPGVPTGRLFHDEFFDARDASAKPPAVEHFHLQLPPGARFDTDAVPHCGASDAQLMAQGASACAPGSEVGKEVFLFDTGVDGPSRIVSNDITFLNDPGELIILTQERQSGTRVVVRGRVGAETLDFTLVPLPGTPPEGGADKREDGVYPVTSWLTTPHSCPPSRVWTFHVDYTFRNGEKVTKTSESPCTPASAAATAARVTFFHRQHARAGRRSRLRVRSTAATPATLRVAGRKRAVRLPAGVGRVTLPRLGRGDYKLSLEPAGGTARTASLQVR